MSLHIHGRSRLSLRLAATGLFIVCIGAPGTGYTQDKKIMRFPPGIAECPPPAGTEKTGNDWLLYKQTDKKGHDIEVYCIAATSSYRVKFSFPGAEPGWVGGCFFPGGRNTSSATVEIKDGEVVDIIDVTQDNVDPTTKDDLHFVFNVAKKELTVQKTKDGKNVGEPKTVPMPKSVEELEKLKKDVHGSEVAPSVQVASLDEWVGIAANAQRAPATQCSMLPAAIGLEATVEALQSWRVALAILCVILAIGLVLCAMRRRQHA